MVDIRFPEIIYTILFAAFTLQIRWRTMKKSIAKNTNIHFTTVICGPLTGGKKTENHQLGNRIDALANSLDQPYMK